MAIKKIQPEGVGQPLQARQAVFPRYFPDGAGAPKPAAARRAKPARARARRT
jgi:hypothetical protein